MDTDTVKKRVLLVPHELFALTEMLADLLVKHLQVILPTHTVVEM